MGFGLRGQDAWRKHPVISNCHKGAFPGFRTAAMIVGAYVLVDQGIKYATSELLAVLRCAWQSVGDGCTCEVTEGHAESSCVLPPCVESCSTQQQLLRHCFACCCLQQYILMLLGALQQLAAPAMLVNLRLLHLPPI
jgi:hypothetical protein